MANANSTIEIELEIKQALDRLNKMQRELQKQADEFDKAGRASEKFERAVKASMSGAGSAIRKALGAFTSLQAAVVGLASAYSAKEFIEFGAAYEREISKLNALTKATAEEQLLLRAAIREVGSSTAYTATQAAEAANVLAALGRSSQQITKELGVVVRVAGATSTEIELVAEAVAAQVNVFELSAKTVGDIFAAAYSTSAANVERLQIALAQVGPVAKAAGLDLYETVGAISFLVDRGFEASSAGTAIRGALTRLIDPSKEVEKVFTELGVSLLQIQKLSFEDQLQLIADKLQNVSTQAERNRILTQIFGVEALAAANNLVEAYGRGNRVLTEQAEKLKAATDAATLYDKITSDLRGAIDGLIAAVQDKLLTAFQTLEPLIKGVVDDLTKSINDLTTLDVVNAVGRLGKFLLTVAEEFYNAIRLAINSISQFLNSSQFSQLMDLAGRALSSLGFTSVEEDIARQEAVFFEALANYRSARADLEKMQQELDPQDEGAQIQIASAQQIADRLQQIMVQEHQRFLLMKAQAEKLREQYELLGPQDDAFARANRRLEEGIQHITERVQETEKLIAKQKEANETAPAGGVSADQVSAQIAKAAEEPLDRMTEKVQLASLATQRLADIINSDLSGPDKINQLEALSQAILDAVDPADFVALGVEADDVYIKLIRLSESADQVAQNLRKAGEQEIQQQGFLAAQQAMKELLRLGEEEKKQRQEVADIIAGINLRGVETSEIEKLNKSYAAEISAIMLNTNYTLSQRVEIANALKDARDREAEGLEEQLSFQQMITDELASQFGIIGQIAKNPQAFLEVTTSFAAQGADYLGEIKGGSPQEMAANAILDLLKQLRIFQQVIEISVGTPVKLLNRLLQPLTNAIERLISNIDGLIEAIGQIADNVGGGVQSALDGIGLGQDSYLFGGGFARDLEQFGSDISLGMFGVDNRAKEEQKNQQLFAQSIEALSDLLKEEQDFLALSDRIGMEGMQTVIDEVTEIFTIAYREMAASISDTALRAELLNQATVELNNRIDELAASFVNTATTEFVGITLTNLSEEYYQLVTNSIAGIDRIRQSALETRLEIQKFDEQMFESGALAELSAEQLDDYNDQLAKLYPMIEAIMEEQIKQFTAASKAQTDAAISEIDRRGIEFTNQQEIEYRYTKEIAAVQADANLTIADQVRLVSALEQARQREIDALERSSYLLDLQAAQTGLADILRDFEKTIEGINELVQGLFDQVTELLFSEFNLMPVMDQFELASDRYAALLEQAFDPNATEEDITNLQAFVNEYLSAARDVYKSSSRFQSIFDQVLQDLTVLGLQYGFTAPVGAVATTRSDVRDLAEELGISMETLIEELDRLAIEFANQQLELIGEVLQVDFAEIIDIQFPDSLDLGEITFTYSLADIDLGMITPTATLTTNTLNLGQVTPTGSFKYSQIDLGKVTPTGSFSSSTLYLGTVQATGSWANNTVNLGTVNATASFNTSGFVNALNNAISQIQTAINNAASSVSGGTTTPVTPQTSIIYSLASGASSIAQYNMASMGPADRSSGVMSIGNTTSTGKNYTDAQYAKAFQGSYESLYGTIPADFGYVVILNAKTANSKYFIAHSSLQSAQSYYNSMLSNSYWAPTKYGFRQGGLVPDPMDTIPAMLSPGEYILSPETVRRFGVSSLNQLNSGDASAISQTNDPEVKRLLAELIQAVRESDTEVNVYTDMRGQAKAAVEEFRSEIKERSRRQGDQFIPVRYI